MEVEQDSLLRQLSGLEDSDLRAILNQTLDETYSRILHDNDLTRRKTQIAEFGIYYAKSFSMINQLTNPSGSKEYTPFRINLLNMADVLKNDDENERDFVESFIHQFWTKCECQKECFLKTPVAEAYEIYLKYLQMKKKERAESVGTLFLNLL